MQLSKITKALLVGACLFATQAYANAPADKAVAQVTRTAASGNVIAENMSKNLFRTETIQVPYTVQVPYQETETYTVQVPYSVQVPYTDYVTDYRQEQRCHNVTRYRQQCHNQQHCYNVPGTGGPRCRMVQECGVNAHGHRICKNRQVCDGHNPPQVRCENRQVCQQVPYTDRECTWVQVPYQRPVTRYRTETQYRTETRTRQVTKYRSETHYRTETRTVFDTQLQFLVEVRFPAEAALAEGQVELLNLNLSASNMQDASVTITYGANPPAFNYVVAKHEVIGAMIRVELAIAPADDLLNPLAKASPLK